MGLFSRKSSLQRSYDAMAPEYHKRTRYELFSKPEIRSLVDQFAEAVAESGPCIDIGCGPGHITQYLHERGVKSCGLDNSARMLKLARKHYPGLDFHRGDFWEMDFKDYQFASAVVMHSLSHVPPSELVQVLLEIRRVIEPGGALLLGFYVGNFSEEVHSWWGQQVELTFHCHRTLDMLTYLELCGFKQVDIYIRPPGLGETFRTAQAMIVAEALPGVPQARRRAARL